MKKLYEKSEITFAILWIVIYTVCMGNLRSLGDDSPILMAALIVISILMFLWVRITGTMEYYGLTGQKTAKPCCGSSRCGSYPAPISGSGYPPTIRCRVCSMQP